MSDKVTAHVCSVPVELVDDCVCEDRIESIAVTDLAGDSTTIPQLLLCANGLMSNRVLLLEQESL